MNYSENYLRGANMLDCELEQFDRNPKEFVQGMNWTKTMQNKAEKVKGKLELVKDDYLKLERIFNDLEDNNPEYGEMELVHHDDVQDYITNLFAGKILEAIKNK